MSRTLMSIALSAVGSAVLAVDFSTSDFGGSPIPIGAGPRAMGMGGAFVAIADDATANSWNPAGITQLERPEAALSFGFYDRATDTPGGNHNSAQVDLDHISFVQPFFLAGIQQTVSLGWQRQFDFTKTVGFDFRSVTTDAFNTTTDQQRVHFKQKGSFSSVSLSYGVEVAPGLSFGVTGNEWGEKFTGRSNYEKHSSESGSVTSVPVNGGPTQQTLTTDDSVEVIKIRSGINVVCGMLWQVYPDLTLGATIKPEFKLHLNHYFDTKATSQELAFPFTSTSSEVTSSDSSVLTYPSSIALGVAWRWNDLQTVSTDVTWTQWSHFATETNGVVTSPINSNLSPSDFSDTVAIRLGYEHMLVLPQFILVPRCGLIYEALPGATKAPSTAAASQVSAKVDNYYGASIGFGLFYRRVLYDFAAQVRYGHDVAAGQETAPNEAANITTYTVRTGITVQF